MGYWHRSAHRYFHDYPNPGIGSAQKTHPHWQATIFRMMDRWRNGMPIRFHSLFSFRGSRTPQLYPSIRFVWYFGTARFPWSECRSRLLASWFSFRCCIFTRESSPSFSSTLAHEFHCTDVSTWQDISSQTPLYKLVIDRYLVTASSSSQFIVRKTSFNTLVFSHWYLSLR